MHVNNTGQKSFKMYDTLMFGPLNVDNKVIVVISNSSNFLW